MTTNTIRDKLISIAKKNNIELFRDQYGNPYARVPTGNARKIFALGEGRTADIRDWLRYQYKDQGQTCSRTPLDDAIGFIRSDAKFEGMRCKLHNRVANTDGARAIWYDLTDPRWRAVKVHGEGWEVEDVPPILFRRYTHQRAQVAPEQIAPQELENHLKTVFEFINLKDDDDTKFLFLIYLITLFIPDIAHPILVLEGEQGSGKNVRV